MDQSEAEAALAAVQGMRSRMALHARWSLARHAGFGVVMGGLVASFAASGAGRLISVLLCLALTGAIALRDRRRDGFFINGYHRGRTRAIAVGTGLFTTAALGVAMLLQAQRGWFWAPVAAGAVVLVVATLASLAWERAYRAALCPGR